MRGAHFTDRFIAGLDREYSDRFALQQQAELKGVSDEIQIDRSNLHSTLRNRDDQSVTIDGMQHRGCRTV